MSHMSRWNGPEEKSTIAEIKNLISKSDALKHAAAESKIWQILLREGVL